MARLIGRYVCSECGAIQQKWLGRCPGCQGWGTLVEERLAPAAAVRPSGRAPVALGSIDPAASPRRSSGIAELDRVLGGGLVPGALILLSGEPGVGKSTLTTMVLANVAAQGARSLLVSGEESPAQIRLRAERLGAVRGVEVLAETDLDVVSGVIESTVPAVAVVDSVQTLWSSDLGSLPGSVAQIREAAGRLLRIAKDTGTTIVLVGHVTKDGGIAGPRVLEHLVDVVLVCEGDRSGALRIVRAAKNRFGATSELGVFEMTGRGLETVRDPSALLAGGDLGAPGSVAGCAIEGSRPLLVEVQALVSQSELPQPRRHATGVDRGRLAMLLAVLHRHAGIALGACDVFVNVAGGFDVDDPAVDLAIAVSVASAHSGRPPGPLLVVGEIGLTGRLRPVPQVDRRLREALRIGIERTIAPTGSVAMPGMVVRTATSIGDAISLALPQAR